MQEHASNIHYAVLVGINAYRDNPLKYCVRDVHEIQTYLETEPNHVKIKTFTAPEAASSDSSQSPQNSTLWPTYERVKAALREVNQQAHAGSFVYIHFSGHGVRTAADDTFSNKSTGDLALALLENDNCDIPRYLWGSELAVILESMVEKGLLVTLVLDCCFSAAVYRHRHPSVRSLPYDAQVDLRFSLDPRNCIVTSPGFLTPADSESRDVSLNPSWRIKADRYSIFTACGPNEIAREFITADGHGHGALSYLLLRVLQEFGGPARQNRFIYDDLRTLFHKYWPCQVPAFYGNKNQSFFGHTGSDKKIGATFPVSKRQDGGLEILAGNAHGILVGDQFLVGVSNSATPDDLSADGSSPLAFRVIHTSPFTSTLQSVDLERFGNDRNYGAAKALTRLCLQKYPIRLQDCLIHPRDEWAAILPQRSLELSVEDAPEDPLRSEATSKYLPRFHFQIALNSDREYEILDISNRKILNLPTLPQDRTDIATVCDVVEHLAKFELVRELVNTAPTDGFSQSFLAEMTDLPGNVYSAGHPIEVDHDINAKFTLELRVENKGAKDLYVYVYNLGPRWQVQNILRGSYEVVPPRQAGQGFSGIFRKKLKTLIPPDLSGGGQTHCKDIVKVFLTSHPTTFDSLELPSIGTLVKRQESSDVGRHSTRSSSANWEALNFVIHTQMR